METTIPLKKIDHCRYEVPASHNSGMRVPGRIYASEKLLEHILKDRALDQVVNVAFLPGIVNYSMAMPDMHWGYGFPIGGVAATDPKRGGVISPGGVGFDINCGVRFIRSHFKEEEIRPVLRELVKTLFDDVPSGMGSKGGLSLTRNELKQVLKKGSSFALEREAATESDLEATEDYGCIAAANPDAVSQMAYERGRHQIGTLGSGNHFLEVQVIDKIFDEKVAQQLHLFEGQAAVMIHCGSRGLGHQVCTDYCKIFIQCMSKYSIKVPDIQLACAPVDSIEGQEYLSAMRAAANFAFCNRQYILHNSRRAFEKVFKKKWQDMGLIQIYDVAHNIAKMEKHRFKGEEGMLCVHRKGATRSFPPGHPDLPDRYKSIGQPVIIPGSMGSFSYLLVGEEGSQETFYSCCHGAGRVKSRARAKQEYNAPQLLKELEAKGIIVQAQSRATITEEAPGVYKDATEVVEVVSQAGLARTVCRMRPIGVVKG